MQNFSQTLRGRVIQPGDPGYDEARTIYNAMLDKRPQLIARCADVADVIAAVQFGREHSLDIAVRGGGHNGPGLALADDGLVIDLSALNGIRVDPETRTAREVAEPIFEHIGPLSYPILQSLFDGLYHPGLQWYGPTWPPRSDPRAQAANQRSQGAPLLEHRREPGHRGRAAL